MGKSAEVLPDGPSRSKRQRVSGASKSPYLGPFITLKLMSNRDPVLSPLNYGRCDPAMLLHLLKEYVDPTMMMGAMTYMPGKQRSWLALLWPILCGLSSSWVPKSPAVDDPDVTDCGDDDAELFVAGVETQDDDGDVSAAGMETQDDELPNSQDICEDMTTTHEDKRVLGKSGTVDFSFKAVSKVLSREFPLEVWKMLADTKDVDLLGGWLVHTLPQMMHYGQQYGIENLAKGRSGSIHLLALARGLFAVAELDCIGVVEVKDGEITKESLVEFREAEKKHWKMMKAKSPSYTRSRYSNQELVGLLGSNSPLLSKTYLVADVYVQKVPGVWDSYVDTVAPNVYGTMMLLEYLLLALLGQRCWRWKAADLDECMHQKKVQLSRDGWLTGANAEQIISNYKAFCSAESR